jgi:hypothetical protein
MASKAMRITDHSCGTDTWRGAIQGAQPPADPPHPERTIRCAPDFRIRSAPRSSRREHRYGRARSRMPPLGTLLRLGASATLELTGLRTPCVLIDRFRSGLKNRLQGKPAGPRFKAGVMAIVTEGGEVSPGDRIRAVFPAPPHLDLPPLRADASSRRVHRSPRSWISGRRLSGVTSIVASVMGSPKRRRPALPGFR